MSNLGSTRLTMKFTATALGLALSVAALAWPAPARAAEDDDASFESKVMVAFSKHSA